MLPYGGTFLAGRKCLGSSHRHHLVEPGVDRTGSNPHFVLEGDTLKRSRPLPYKAIWTAPWADQYSGLEQGQVIAPASRLRDLR